MNPYSAIGAKGSPAPPPVIDLIRASSPLCRGGMYVVEGLRAEMASVDY
jgi:hypothetical protein